MVAPRDRGGELLLLLLLLLVLLLLLLLTMMMIMTLQHLQSIVLLHSPVGGGGGEEHLDLDADRPRLLPSAPRVVEAEELNGGEQQGGGDRAQDKRGERVWEKLEAIVRLCRTLGQKKTLGSDRKTNPIKYGLRSLPFAMARPPLRTEESSKFCWESATFGSRLLHRYWSRIDRNGCFTCLLKLDDRIKGAAT